MDCRWHHGSSVHDSRYLADGLYNSRCKSKEAGNKQHSNLQSQRKYTDDQGLGKHVGQYEIWQQKENQKDQKGRCKERCHNYFSQCV